MRALGWAHVDGCVVDGRRGPGRDRAGRRAFAPRLRAAPDLRCRRTVDGAGAGGAELSRGGPRRPTEQRRTAALWPLRRGPRHARPRRLRLRVGGVRLFLMHLAPGPAEAHLAEYADIV